MIHLHTTGRPLKHQLLMLVTRSHEVNLSFFHLIAADQHAIRSVMRTLEVASSRMRMRAFCSSARAMHSSCRWPVLKLAPPSTSSASSLPCEQDYKHS